MKQLTAIKKKKLLSALKNYKKKYLIGKYNEVDESATRLMINTFLTDVLGFISLDEIKTEYMIKGTYADYIVQLKKNRYFIVEVKAMPIELSEKHLRQAVNYAANEGIEWALLTNGRKFDFYKIIFDKPIDSKQIFSIDLSDENNIKSAAENLQYLTRSLISNKELEDLWRKHSALDPTNVGRLLLSKSILKALGKELKRSFKNKFTDEDVEVALRTTLATSISIIEPIKTRRRKRGKKKNTTESVSSGNSTPENQPA